MQSRMMWTNIKYKKPTKDGRYLVIEDCSYKWIGVCYFRNNEFDAKITHWMELPNLPEN